MNYGEDPATVETPDDPHEFALAWENSQVEDGETATLIITRTAGSGQVKLGLYGSTAGGFQRHPRSCPAYHQNTEQRPGNSDHTLDGNPTLTHGDADVKCSDTPRWVTGVVFKNGVNEKRLNYSVQSSGTFTLQANSYTVGTTTTQTPNGASATLTGVGQRLPLTNPQGQIIGMMPHINASMYKSVLPNSHNNVDTFQVRVDFDQNPELSFRSFLGANRIVKVYGGEIAKAKRVIRGDNRYWDLTVRPRHSSFIGREIELVIPETEFCLTNRTDLLRANPYAVCTAEGHRMAESKTLVIPYDNDGNPILTVGANTTAPSEGQELIFTFQLDKPIPEGKHAELGATINISGENNNIGTDDYEYIRGDATVTITDTGFAFASIRFGEGQQRKTIRVKLKDDYTRESKEYVRLSVSGLGVTVLNGVSDPDELPLQWSPHYNIGAMDNHAIQVEVKDRGPAKLTLTWDKTVHEGESIVYTATLDRSFPEDIPLLLRFRGSEILGERPTRGVAQYTGVFRDVNLNDGALDQSGRIRFTIPKGRLSASSVTLAEDGEVLAGTALSVIEDAAPEGTEYLYGHVVVNDEGQAGVKVAWDTAAHESGTVDNSSTSKVASLEIKTKIIDNSPLARQIDRIYAEGKILAIVNTVGEYHREGGDAIGYGVELTRAVQHPDNGPWKPTEHYVLAEVVKDTTSSLPSVSPEDFSNWDSVFNANGVGRVQFADGVDLDHIDAISAGFNLQPRDDGLQEPSETLAIKFSKPDGLGENADLMYFVVLNKITGEPVGEITEGSVIVRTQIEQSGQNQSNRHSDACKCSSGRRAGRQAPAPVHLECPIRNARTHSGFHARRSQ